MCCFPFLSLASTPRFDASDIPNLKSPCAEDTRPLVLCHVWCGGALVVWHLLVLDALDRVLLLCFGRSRSAWIAPYDDVVVGVLVIWVGLVAGASLLWLILLVEFGLGLLIVVESLTAEASVAVRGALGGR